MIENIFQHWFTFHRKDTQQVLVFLPQRRVLIGSIISTSMCLFLYVGTYHDGESFNPHSTGVEKTK